MSGTSSRPKRYSGACIVLPEAIFLSPEYARLSPAAVKVLLFCHLQFTGRNNGDLTITAKAFRTHGFRSKATLWKAKDELLAAGWLQMTRQGGLHHPSLYALTWEQIDPSDKYDVGIKAGPPTLLWRDQFASQRDAPSVTPKPSNRGFAQRIAALRDRTAQPVTQTTLPHGTGHVGPRHGLRKV
jgi:hypothetical protein